MADTPITDPAGAPKAGAVTRGRLLVRYALLVLTAVVLIDSIVGEKGVLALVRAREDLRALEQAVQAARVENQRMLEQARKYREDPATIEELARHDLGLIKPGEKLFIIRDLPPAPTR